jgi:hypothetical protein
MATPGPHTAFFYGTLMAPSVLYRVIYGNPQPLDYQKQQTSSAPALLEGYERRKVQGCDYPAITACGGGCVRGLLVKGLRDMDLVHLDTFEGSQYTREVVKVRVLREGEKEEKGGENAEAKADEVGSESELVEAQTYVWSEGTEWLEEEEWDFEEFRREKLLRWAGVMDWEDDGFEDVDRQVEEENAKDPTGGRAANGAIGKELQNMRSAVETEW